MGKKNELGGYERLANAIIQLAAQDYMKALRALKRNSSSRMAKQIVDENEKFFRSDWYMTLTNVDGDYLIRRMKEKVGYEG